jgi:poly-gamma-glutamate capsule biosynthesis protein CapA/YwtB (metallophosphatase superfamily)
VRRIYFLAIFIVLVFSAFFIGARAGEVYPLDTFFEWTSENGTEEGHNNPDEELYEEEEEDPDPELNTVNLVAVGNIFPHVPQIEQAHVGDGVYDFSPSFEIIAPLLQAADIAVGDLETSQAGPDVSFNGAKGYSGFPMFNAPQELSVALRDAGIDILTLGNNHALDRGYEGLLVTLDHLRSIGITTFGAYKSQEERDTPVIYEKEGIRIAFIGYTFSTNGIPVPVGHEYCINFAPGFQDLSPVIEDIETAKRSGADIIAVFPHWGENEYAQEPQPQYYRQVAEELAAAGADLIIGGHPKYVQPIEWFFNSRPDGTERATLAIYSQGTFLSNQHYPANISPFVEYGLLLDIDLTKNLESGEAWISGVDYEITWIHREWRHRILPLSQVFAGSPQDYNLSETKIEDLKSWYQRNIEAAEAYGHQEGKSRAMAISDRLINAAHGN